MVLDGYGLRDERQARLTTLQPVFSRRARFWLSIGSLVQLGVLYGLSAARFHNVHQRTFDLALYARIAFGLAHGDVSSRVLDTYPLGTHLSPVLVPLGLLGRLLPTVHVLLFAQALCVALSVFPIARIGARHMGNSGIALAAAAWWLYPNLFHVATYEFHPGTLAVLPICWGYDALERGHARDLTLASAGVLACREDLGLICAVLALLAYARFRRSSALQLAAGCVAYTLLATLFVLGHAPAGGSLDQHFGVWGGSPLGVASTLLHEPTRVLDHFRAPHRLWYVPRLLAVLSFFPLRAAWLLLPALPYLALNLLSDFPTATAQFSHYLTPSVPALVVSGIVGASAIRRRPLRVLWLGTLALGHYALGGSPLSRDFERAAFRADAQSEAAHAILAQLAAGASVAAPDPLLPHLAERSVLRRAPPPVSGTQLVVLDISHRERFSGREDLLRTSEEPFVREFFARSDHGLLLYAPPYALFERGLPPRSAAAKHACLLEPEPEPEPEPEEAVALSACLSIADALLRQQTLELTLIAQGPCRADLALRFGPEQRPWRVELICAGELSPAHFRRGDRLRSRIVLARQELDAARAGALWFGAVRADGKTPEPSDPLATRVRVRQHEAR